MHNSDSNIWISKKNNEEMCAEIQNQANIDIYKCELLHYVNQEKKCQNIYIHSMESDEKENKKRSLVIWLWQNIRWDYQRSGTWWFCKCEQLKYALRKKHNEIEIS